VDSRSLLPSAPKAASIPARRLKSSHPLDLIRARNQKMKTHGSATTFHVADVSASLRFYTAILGFSERFRFGDYAGVEYGVVQIHLSAPGSMNKRQIGQGGIYIFCDAVDAYYSEIISKGGIAQAPPKDYAYGMRDFAITDPDGNLLGFAQETKSAPDVSSRPV
jgi:catechol 2,3-dioxygenase-like lactoylglutathione lyase family enzyme